MREYIALVLVLTGLISYAGGCVFPSDLSGAWYSSTKGLLNISSTSSLTTIYSYSTDKFGSLDLTCNVTSGSNYVFQSPTFSYLGLQFQVFLCFNLASNPSSSKYIYYLGSVENTDADNERLKTPLVSIGYNPTTALVCDRTSYAAGTEHVFLKNDGSEADSKLAFPFDMRGTWYYNFTSSSTTTCGSNSSANICSASDTSTMTFDYTLCSSVQAYSATGVLYNMWYSSDSSYTYLHVYNTDSSTDESTTYRFTCYVVSVSDTTMYASQYPKSCQSSQTPTSVSSPGATVVFAQTATCPYDTTSTVISTASAVGITVGVFFIVIIIVCGALLWHYYKKRKRKQAMDKLPLQKAQPANKKLTNGDLFRDSKSRISRIRDSKTPATMNGDVRINMDTDPSIRRENSICISVTQSRGGSGIGLDNGMGPVEEPEKVNYLSDDVITEIDNEAALAATFLPISPSQKSTMHYTDKEIQEIEKKAEEKVGEDEFDMDAIDDELGLPRLSRAFTPVVDLPEPPTLPALDYKKDADSGDESGVERTADGVVKVKLKKKKKPRVRSSKKHIKGRPGSSPTKLKKERETPFLDRIKKQENEKVEMQQRQRNDKETKEVANGEIKSRLSKDPQAESQPSSDKYMVDDKRNQGIRHPDKRALKAPSGDQRRRFGDPLPESARANRKRTPRIRHPMEVQESLEKAEEKQQEGLQKEEGFWRDEKLRRSGRSRKHPEARVIPSVKEDPFDHQERAPVASAISQARSGKSTLGLGLERENSSFIDPKIGGPSSDEVWSKASNMWHFKNQPAWGNLGYHKH